MEVNMSEAELREQIYAILYPYHPFEGTNTMVSRILDLIKQSGYLSVEPVQLEVLTDEDIDSAWLKCYESNINTTRIERLRAISQATIAKNSKTPLYRRRE
jgi:hypothetical protein